MQKLTNEFLNSSLELLTTHSIYMHSGTKEYFTDLYNTGCRPSELLNVDNWQYSNDGYKLRMSKTGNERIFEPQCLSESMVRAVNCKSIPYNGLTYHQAVLEFQKYMLPFPIFTENKQVELYLFRYNTVRRLFALGLERKFIMLLFNWESLSLVDRYLNTDLYY